jgi:hypothetical protein
MTNPQTETKLEQSPTLDSYFGDRGFTILHGLSYALIRGTEEVGERIIYTPEDANDTLQTAFPEVPVPRHNGKSVDEHGWRVMGVQKRKDKSGVEHDALLVGQVDGRGQSVRPDGAIPYKRVSLERIIQLEQQIAAEHEREKARTQTGQLGNVAAQMSQNLTPSRRPLGPELSMQVGQANLSTDQEKPAQPPTPETPAADRKEATDYKYQTQPETPPVWNQTEALKRNSRFMTEADEREWDDYRAEVDAAVLRHREALVDGENIRVWRKERDEYGRGTRSNNGPGDRLVMSRDYVANMIYDLQHGRWKGKFEIGDGVGVGHHRQVVDLVLRDRGLEFDPDTNRYDMPIAIEQRRVARQEQLADQRAAERAQIDQQKAQVIENEQLRSQIESIRRNVAPDSEIGQSLIQAEQRISHIDNSLDLPRLDRNYDDLSHEAMQVSRQIAALADRLRSFQPSLRGFFENPANSYSDRNRADEIYSLLEGSSNILKSVSGDEWLEHTQKLDLHRDKLWVLQKMANNGTFKELIQTLVAAQDRLNQI